MIFKLPPCALNALISLILISAAEGALARFNHHDAELVDPEERNNTETYNDKNSYRYPRKWDEVWGKNQFGYRSHAGSLNASRFLYEDEIIIAPDPLAKFSASFSQSRREDLVEQYMDREIRLGWAFVPGARISLLGDGDTFKEFGDLGLALAFFESPQGMVEVYYWSVDNYYASKKSDTSAHRHANSHTIGIHATQKQLSEGLNVSLQLENDSPLEWHYPNRGFEYEYWRKFAALRVERAADSRLTFYFDTRQEQKMEHKISLVLAPTAKRMLKRVSEIEAGLDLKTEEKVCYTAAIQHLMRHVDYENAKSKSESLLWQETVSPSKVRRYEWGLIFLRYGSLSDHSAIQHGFYANDVLIREDAKEWKVWELKYQLLLDFELNPNTKLGLNTTWDLDQIMRDYPYSKKAPFRPWGGGDLQFLMYF